MNLHNIMSEVLNNSQRYILTRDIQIKTIRIIDQNKYMLVEIVIEDNSSTPCLIEQRGFTQREVNEIMDRLTAAL